jgi:hypothetical protein
MSGPLFGPVYARRAFNRPGEAWSLVKDFLAPPFFSTISYERSVKSYGQRNILFSAAV